MNIVTDGDLSDNAATRITDNGVEYTPHSMMHKAIVQMDPTKLAMLEGFKSVNAGYKFVPEDSNVRVIITGRDWSEKRILIYGCKSTTEARKHTHQIIRRVHAIDFEARLVEGPIIRNIAVNGDLDKTFQLERVSQEIQDPGIQAEYEPEQFSAVILKIESPPATFLLFSTGKFIIQGLNKIEHIEPTIDRIQNNV